MSDKASYTGPIENIRPGDIITWERMDEYREFMRTKKNIKNIKLWGLNEDWEDNRQRPFDEPLSAKQEPTEPNPFEI